MARKSVKNLIPFYAFDKQIAYSPRKKGEKVVFKEPFTFEGGLQFVGIDPKTGTMTVEADTMYVGKQLLYIGKADVEGVLSSCLMNLGRMHGNWELYRSGNKILLRYADYIDNHTPK